MVASAVSGEEPKGPWSVYRLDDCGNVFEMRWDLSRARADQIAKEFNAKGHHQTYRTGLPVDQPEGVVRLGMPDQP